MYESRKMEIYGISTKMDEWINEFEEGYWTPLSMLASLMEEVGELAREIIIERIITKKEI